MIVVEIGCGTNPGPYWEGNENHFIVDRSNFALALGADKDPRLDPLYFEDALSLPMLDESVDLVLARNVFGDFNLGGERNQHQYKLQIVLEASRVLMTGGKLLVIEDLTPAVSERFFSKLSKDPNSSVKLEFEEVDIAVATPPSYSAIRGQNTNKALLGTRAE